MDRQKKRLLISHLVANRFLWGFLEATGAADAISKENFFEDTDAALEWAEDHMLVEFYSEEDSEVYRLSYEHFGKLCWENSGIAVKLLQNIAVVLSHRLRVRSEEVRMLEDG